MAESKIINTRRNLIYGLVNKIVLMICPFIVRSIIIWKLGMEYVGLGSLFASILQVLSLAELGFGSAIVYGMYKPIAMNNKEEICALLNFYKKVYYLIGTVVLCAGLCLLPFLDKLISGDCPSDINVKTLFLIYLANTVASYFLMAYKQSLLLANQRVDIENNISTILYFLMYCIQIIMLLISGNYYLYIIWLPITTIVLNIVRSYKVDRLFPGMKCVGKLSKETKKDMYKRVYGLMLTRLCQVCRNSFDSIAISAFLGLSILGRYQSYYYVMNTIISFMLIITTSIVAGIGNNIATKSISDNYKEFSVFYFGYNWLSSWCAVCLLCMYQPFMRIWVGEQNMFPFSLVIFMCAYFYFMKIGDVVSVYKEATGIYWEDRNRPIFESVANLILNFALVNYFGVYGVVLATIITIVLINIPWSTIVLFRSYFKIQPKEYLLKVLFSTIKLIAVSFVTLLVCNTVKAEGVICLVYRGIICIIVPNILLLLLNMRNKSMVPFFNMVKKILGVK